jgi:hypothetical protein
MLELGRGYQVRAYPRRCERNGYADHSAQDRDSAFGVGVPFGPVVDVLTSVLGFIQVRPVTGCYLE